MEVNQEFNLNKQEERFLTTAEAAHFLGITSQALLNLVSNGKVPHYKFGRRNRYCLNELRQMISKNKRGPRDGY